MIDATLRRLSSLLLLSLAATTGCAPEGSEELEAALAAEDEGESQVDERSIIGGTSASAYPEGVLIDMAQGGQLVSICSGAMIRPRVVLTAGHCVLGFDGFLVEAPFAGVTAQATAAALYDWNNDGEYVDPSQHDVALLFLDRDVPLAQYPTFATQRAAWGTRVKNIGRIDDGQASWSSLFISAAVTVSDGAQWGFPYAYVSSEKIQSGDSGGPVVQEGTHHIVAVNSGSGGGTQVLARVDLVAPWIQQQIAAWEGGQVDGGDVEPPPEPEDPCGGITYEGECTSSREVTWCEGGEVKSMRCTGNRRCKLNQAAGYYDCLR